MQAVRLDVETSWFKEKTRVKLLCHHLSICSTLSHLGMRGFGLIWQVVLSALVLHSDTGFSGTPWGKEKFAVPGRASLELRMSCTAVTLSEPFLLFGLFSPTNRELLFASSAPAEPDGALWHTVSFPYLNSWYHIGEHSSFAAISTASLRGYRWLQYSSVKSTSLHRRLLHCWCCFFFSF